MRFRLSDAHGIARIINQEIPYPEFDPNGLNASLRFMAANTRDPETINLVSRITNLSSLEMAGIIASVAVISFGVHLVITYLRQLHTVAENNNLIGRLEVDIPDILSFMPERVGEATENLRLFLESDELLIRTDLNYIPDNTMETIDRLNINYNIMLDEFGETLASEDIRNMLAQRYELSNFDN